MANTPATPLIDAHPGGFLFSNKFLKVFIMKKTKTYMDKLMENKEFREKFDKEYQNLCVAEKIARIRHRANLRQDEPVNRKKNNIQLFNRVLKIVIMI
jgi:hypothetical protein